MIILLLIIFVTICGVQGLQDRTIAANPGEFKYFVMICFNGEFRCGGIIIDQRHIITRGSCVAGIPSFNLSIIAGTINTKFATRPFQVGSVHFHYGFKEINDAMLSEIYWVHDIAVLKLIDRMVWDLLTAPAALITWENCLEVSGCVVPGWRHTRIGQPKEHYYIRWIVGAIYSAEKCIHEGVRLLKNEKCVTMAPIRIDWKSTMHYYSGSPVACSNGVIGIVDRQSRTGIHIFLDLLPYKEFIENAIDDSKHDVNPGEMEYVVSVWYEGRFKCGGIIFDASHILTTGDCVQYANKTNVRVIAGRTQVLEDDPQIQWMLVRRIQIHPNYEEVIHFDGPKFMHVKNNYAILTLAVPLQWGPTIGPAFLSNTHFVPTNSSCGAYRWHKAYTVDDKIVLQLIWSQEFIMNADDCQGAGVNLEADEICVSSQYAQHPKNLDSSGNPVVCDGFVIGIIIPNYSIVPQFSCLTSILSISPFVNSLNSACYVHPIY